MSGQEEVLLRCPQCGDTGVSELDKCDAFALGHWIKGEAGEPEFVPEGTTTYENQVPVYEEEVQVAFCRVCGWEGQCTALVEEVPADALEEVREAMAKATHAIELGDLESAIFDVNLAMSRMRALL